jgi:hypothetical protein
MSEDHDVLPRSSHAVGKRVAEADADALFAAGRKRGRCADQLTEAGKVVHAFASGKQIHYMCLLICDRACARMCGFLCVSCI